jgi:hypothetical protein
MFLENWQVLPCIQKSRFPPIWVCCVGESKGKIVKTGSITNVFDEYGFEDSTNKIYSLERLNGKHLDSNPLKWTRIPSNFENIITEYLIEELKYDSLATQLIQCYYYQTFDTEG